jgi:hypothetical protein
MTERRGKEIGGNGEGKTWFYEKCKKMGEKIC